MEILHAWLLWKHYSEVMMHQDFSYLQFLHSYHGPLISDDNRISQIRLIMVILSLILYIIPYIISLISLCATHTHTHTRCVFQCGLNTNTSHGVDTLCMYIPCIHYVGVTLGLGDRVRQNGSHKQGTAQRRRKV